MKNETYMPIKTAIRDFLCTYIKKHGNKLLDEMHMKATRSDMISVLVNGILDEEMDAVLGYSRYDNRNKGTKNIRNGHFIKYIHTSAGDIKINMPRDRQGKFEPVIIKKYQNSINYGMEKKLISLYAENLSDLEMEDQVRSLYEEEISKQLADSIREKVRSVMNNWQQRPLKEVYAVVFLDSMTYYIKPEGTDPKRTVYMLYGITLNGCNELLGVYIKKEDRTEFWIKVLERLKNRGVKDILIACTEAPDKFIRAVDEVYGEKNHKNP